jgi:hypothetical protein
VSVLLRHRCRLWATATGSSVPGMAESDVPRPWAEAMLQRSELEGDLTEAEFKNPRRAAEKARTCYGGDVSQLLDICR